jgi:hypothetical protein
MIKGLMKLGYIILAFILIQHASVIADEQDWQDEVYHFRSSHQFSMSGGPFSSTWEVENFNSIDERQTIRKVGGFANFRYSFHIHLIQDIGYYVGSAFGFELEQSQSQEKIQYTNKYSLPGISLGLVYNYSPKYRLIAGTDIQLERWDKFKEYTDESVDSPSVSVNANAITFILSLDTFKSATWAFRVSYESKYSTFMNPQNSYEPLDATIEQYSQRIGFGAVYHLL